MSYPTSLQGMQKKLNDMLTRNSAKAQEHIQKIQHDIEYLEDFVVPSNASDALQFRSNGTIRIAFDDNEFELHPHALRQLATRYDIPTKYAANLAETDWGRTLLRRSFEEHKNNKGSKRFLIRAIDNQARAVLSDSYRRMNSNLIYKNFLQAASENQAVLYDALYTETKTSLDVIIPHVYEVETKKNGIVYSLFGGSLRNSDFGAGALESKVRQINLVCDNGITSESLLKQIHLGAKLPENINFSLETYNNDTKTQASAVRDIIQTSLSSETIMKTVRIMKEASMVDIDFDKEVKKLSKVMDKHEIEILDSKLKNNREEDGLVGEPTKWKLCQAVNSVSNHEDVSAERKLELDELAGKIINFKL